MTNQKEIETLAKKLWSENKEVATELANVIFGIRDGVYGEPEFKYPIFKKSKITGLVARFTGLKEGDEVISDTKWLAGEHRDNFTPHTDTDRWKDVPYDKEGKLYHGQPVYVWDNSITHQRYMGFYDVINKTIFSYSGFLNGIWSDNYVAIPTEHIPAWMYEAYETLEGI